MQSLALPHRYVCWEVITVENQRLFRKCSCLQNKVKNLWLRTDSINSERTKLFIMFVDRGREQTYLGLNKLDQLKICILTYMLYRNWQYYVMCTETHLLIVWYSTYYVPHEVHTRPHAYPIAIPVGHQGPIIPIRYDWYERWVIVGDA